MSKHKSPNTAAYIAKQQSMIAAAKDFINGMPMKQVLEKHSVSYASVYNAIKRYNLQYKYTYGRTVFFNEDYFADIDNEHKAYWLGFLYADGCIMKTDSIVSDCNRLTLSLSVQDKEHVINFAKDINMPLQQVRVHHKPGFNDGSWAATLHCNSLKMCKDLQKLGYTKLKSERVGVPDIQEELMHHFIRGYFDADGSVWGDFKRGGLSFHSSGYVLETINQILHMQCNVPLKHLTVYRNSLRFSYGSREHITRIANYMYKEATIFLVRKLQAMCRRCFR